MEAIAIVLATCCAALACLLAVTGRAYRQYRRAYEDVTERWFTLPVPVRLQAERARYMRDTHYPAKRLDEVDVMPTWLLEELLAERMRVRYPDDSLLERDASYGTRCIDCVSRRENASRCATCPIPATPDAGRC